MTKEPSKRTSYASELLREAEQRFIERNQDTLKQCGFEKATRLDRYNLAISYELLMKD